MSEPFEQKERGGEDPSLTRGKDDDDSNSSSSDSSSSNDSDSSSPSGSDDDSEDESGKAKSTSTPSLPVHFPVEKKDHFKAVTAIAVDSSGSRLVTGSIDGTVLVWDIARVSSASLRPFRTLATTSSLTGGAIDQSVTSVQFSGNGAFFAVARSDPQVRIYTKEGTNGSGGSGEAKVTTTRGDPYIRDMSQTKGHVGGVSQVRWSTAKQEMVFSSGAFDGTVRIWDIEHGPKALMGMELACSHILKIPPRQAARPSLQAMALTNDSRRILAAGSGALLYLWDARAGGVFSAMPDKSFSCGSSTSDFVGLEVDDTGANVIIAQKDAFEVRDSRKLDKAVWSQRGLKDAVKSVGFHGRDLVVGSVSSITVYNVADGRVLFEEREAGLSSNVVWADDKLFRGRADGTVVVSFDEETGYQALSATTKHLARSAGRRDEVSFANIDRSKLVAEEQILPAHEARKLMRKKAKHSDDDLD